jgi:hypothetical protein
VGAEERRDWRQAITMFMRASQRSRRWEWSGPEIPPVKPIVRDLFVAQDGRIWVRLSQSARLNPEIRIPDRPPPDGARDFYMAADRWSEPTVYDVLEPGGRYVGQVRFPVEVRASDYPFSATGDTVWAVVVDANGVPLVRRYRIQWESQ